MKENKEEWRSAKYYKSKTGVVENLNEIEITSTGNIRYSKTKKKINISNSNKKGYPIVRFYKNKKQHKYSIHVLVASTFLETPNSSGYFVDHIDRNKQHFDISNLRFVTISENAKNSSLKSQNIVFINIKSKKIINTLDITVNKRKYINRIINKKSETSDWITMSLDMYCRYNKINIFLEINRMLSENWIKISNNKYINNKGELKSFKNRTKIPNFSFGNLNTSGYYVTSKVFKKYSNLVHRIVAQVFLNNDRPLNDRLIDHIDSNPKNNSFDNLKIVKDQKENISNPNTILKMSKQIKCTLMDGDILYFTSRDRCSELLNVRKGTILSWIKDNSKIQNLYPEIKSLCYIESPIPEGSKINIFNLTKYTNFSIDVRKYKSLTDINNFLLENKITSRKDLENRGYLNLYWKIKSHKWTKLITYYKGANSNKD